MSASASALSRTRQSQAVGLNISAPPPVVSATPVLWRLTRPSPLTGESWGHACTNRIILFWQHNVRQAKLFKSPGLRELTVAYDVTVSASTQSTTILLYADL
jgi:hypothetical protein